MDRLQSGSIRVFNIFALVVFFKFCFCFLSWKRLWLWEVGEEQGTISNCSNCEIKTPNRREERRRCAVVLCCAMCFVTTLVNSFQYKLMCACFVSSYSSFFLDKTKVWLSFTVNKLIMQHYLLAHWLL